MTMSFASGMAKSFRVVRLASSGCLFGCEVEFLLRPRWELLRPDRAMSLWAISKLGKWKTSPGESPCRLFHPRVLKPLPILLKQNWPQYGILYRAVVKLICVGIGQLRRPAHRSSPFQSTSPTLCFESTGIVRDTSRSLKAYPNSL
jgi:hypothetical protein